MEVPYRTNSWLMEHLLFCFKMNMKKRTKLSFRREEEKKHPALVFVISIFLSSVTLNHACKWCWCLLMIKVRTRFFYAIGIRQKKLDYATRVHQINCMQFVSLTSSLDRYSKQSVGNLVLQKHKENNHFNRINSFPLWNISNTLIESYEGQISTWITIGDTSWYEWNWFWPLSNQIHLLVVVYLLFKRDEKRNSFHSKSIHVCSCISDGCDENYWISLNEDFL